jgi:hypothetical protein
MPGFRYVFPFGDSVPNGNESSGPAVRLVSPEQLQKVRIKAVKRRFFLS